MKTVVQPYDEEVDVTVLEVDMPEPELLEQKTGSPEVTPEDWEKVKPIYTDFMQSYTSHPEQPVEQWLGGKLQEYLPEEPSEEIHKMTDEIVTTLPERSDAPVPARSCCQWPQQGELVCRADPEINFGNVGAGSLGLFGWVG